MTKFILAVLTVVCLAALSDARPVRVTSTKTEQSECKNGVCRTFSSDSLTVRGAGSVLVQPQRLPAGDPLPKQTKEPPVIDALDIVNKKRSEIGLPPLLKDDGLTVGAIRLSQHRASRLLAGHTSNDFQFLPPGASATASGCCYTPRSDWGACAWDSRTYTRAGAAVAIVNGRWFCSIFVR